MYLIASPQKASKLTFVCRSNEKEHTSPHPDASSCRLVTYSGRTEESVQHVLDSAHKHAEDVDLQALLQESANMPAASHPYRGFTVLNTKAEQRCDVIEVCVSSKSFGVLGKH